MCLRSFEIIYSATYKKNDLSMTSSASVTADYWQLTSQLDTF